MNGGYLEIRNVGVLNIPSLGQKSYREFQHSEFHKFFLDENQLLLDFFYFHVLGGFPFPTPTQTFPPTIPPADGPNGSPTVNHARNDGPRNTEPNLVKSNPSLLLLLPKKKKKTTTTFIFPGKRIEIQKRRETLSFYLNSPRLSKKDSSWACHPLPPVVKRCSFASLT
ncbi:hypothetical protein CKAN_02533100 [Cinnamomum micranthum f. kanehirae]|uniref:Uncharacterized protein n=1 Tax=Cinnamomum micranthum f. kanehirae TaxID=337451 RepID=A0A3S3R658_9MAGN|nr:hypothetical protein CKAN_02533100 [Cinnamomum micranthum f. kanehirae]